jgi:hypothetical protein
MKNEIRNEIGCGQVLGVEIAIKVVGCDYSESTSHGEYRVLASSRGGSGGGKEGGEKGEATSKRSSHTHTHTLQSQAPPCLTAQLISQTTILSHLLFHLLLPCAPLSRQRKEVVFAMTKQVCALTRFAQCVSRGLRERARLWVSHE